jgi:thiol-disulfide isomerase/thioredoxin
MTLPPFEGAAAWLNSGPLRPEELRGRVVLVDFWTLTCINWLRTEPWIRAWSQAYADDGLVVIGVHTPEFSFEHDVGLVRRAVADRGIGYPVAVDNDYAIWSAFDNHYWPALYFADREGVIRDAHFGEGRYDKSEREIQRLLGVKRDPVPVSAAGVEAEADWRHLRTPETYLGHQRGSRGGQWSTAGDWTTGPESLALNRAGGSISFRFHARDAHLVLAGGDADPIPFEVRLDGLPPGPAHGVDVDEDGRGVLREGRLYQLIRQPAPIHDRTLEITFSGAGVEAYSFTFG